MAHVKMPRTIQESCQIAITIGVLDIYVQFIVLDGRTPAKLQANTYSSPLAHSKAHAGLKGKTDYLGRSWTYCTSNRSAIISQ